MINYRKALHADVNAIMEIMNQNLAEYQQYVEFEAGHHLPDRFTDMYIGQYLEIEDVPLFVAEDATDDGPLICGSVIALSESMLNPDLEPSEHLHITNLDVRTEYRNQGIGSALVACVEDWARRHKFRALFVETYTHNAIANTLFKSGVYETVKEVRRKRL